LRKANGPPHGFSLADAWRENEQWNFAPLTTKVAPTTSVQEFLKLGNE
jgi:hypothetical protein